MRVSDRTRTCIILLGRQTHNLYVTLTNSSCGFRSHFSRLKALNVSHYTNEPKSARKDSNLLPRLHRPLPLQLGRVAVKDYRVGFEPTHSRFADDRVKPLHHRQVEIGGIEPPRYLGSEPSSAPCARTSKLVGDSGWALTSP